MGTLSNALLFVLNSAKVALGVGFVIFIHELGHFLLAKWNGVKVEKFSIGFGPTLFGFRRGETEYVLAAVPLGGFVKMLGENPEGEEAKTTDARAFHNKSVGARMAIISAGVIMNILFGIVCNAFWFTQPREELSARVGAVSPGSPAYEAGLRTGDEIVSIDGQPEISFGDLTRKVSLSSEGQVLNFVIKREGAPQPISFDIKPRLEGDQDRPVMGVQNSSDLEILGFLPPAGMADPPTYPAIDPEERQSTVDMIKSIRIDDGPPVPLRHIDELQGFMSRNAGKELTLQIERKFKESSAKPFDFKLPRNNFVDFGMHLAISPIVAVQKDSLAEKAGLKVGDEIVEFAGKDDFDPMRLPTLWFENQGKPVTIVVERKGSSAQKDRVSMTVTPGANPPWIEYSQNLVPTLDIPGLGICYQVVAKVRSVVPDSPAAKAGIKPGDVIDSMTLSPPPAKDGKEPVRSAQEFKFGTSPAWVKAFMYLQSSPSQSVKLSLNKSSKAVEIQPVPDPHWHNPVRGLFFFPLKKTAPPQDFARAVRSGLSKTYDDVIDIYTMLRGLFQRRIGPGNLGGPILIAQVAYSAAGHSWTDLIGFLGMMSINLAVLNFLPIPPLDGGQMVFLLAEKVRGRPLPESVLMGAIYIGLPLLLLVMVFVTYQDIFRLFIGR